MAQPATRSIPVTIDEYLAIEFDSNTKHEYVDGDVYAVAGGTQRHNIVAANVIVALGNAVRGSGCRLYTSDQLVRAGESAVYYPDVTISCEQEPDQRLVTRPCLIVEVLSPSTASTDRREKLLAYRGCPTLRDYLIIDPEWRTVERHFRAGDAAWWREQYDDGVMPAGCLAGTFIQIADFFHDLDDLPPLTADR